MPTAAYSLDDTLLALAAATRRAILQRLAKGETRVTDLAEPFDLSLNSVSKHIRILERASLVRRRVSGREHLLSLNPAPLDEAAEWINRQRAFWNDRLDALDAMLRSEDTARPRRPARTRDGRAPRKGELR
jgi:DNA-binding transcriptional ArsR family regulator